MIAKDSRDFVIIDVKPEYHIEILSAIIDYIQVLA